MDVTDVVNVLSRLGGRSSVVRVRRGGHHPAVPAISRFFGIVIAMYFDDHGPPHFHARHAAELRRSARAGEKLKDIEPLH